MKRRILLLLILLCTFATGAWAIEVGKVYTIKAHFSSYNDLNFTVRSGALSFDIMYAANDDVYKWTAETTDDTNHPWAFKNVATGKYLNGETGVSDTKTGFKLTEQTNGCVLMRGVAGGSDRNLGTWAASDTNQTKGFGNNGHACYSTNGTYDGNWTTYYEIKEANDATQWYYMQMTATSAMYIYANSNENFVKQGTTAPTTDTQTMYMWKIEGNASQGYKIINKGTGKMIACTSLTTKDGSTKATLVETEADGVYTRFAMGPNQENLQVLNAEGTGSALYLCAFSKNYTETRFYGTKHSTCNVKLTPATEDYYTISCTGLAVGETGGVCYNRVNYTGKLVGGSIDTQALLAMHVSGYNGTVTVDDAAKTISVAYDKNFSSSSTLWDDNGLTDKIPAARIPALVRTANGDLLAFSDWRYNKNDIGRGDNGKRIDIEMRRSTDNGATWSPAIIVAQGTGISGYEAAHGDAAVVADHTTVNSQKVLMMAASGNATDFTSSTRNNKIQVAKFLSNDNGATWTKSNFTDNIYNSLPTSVTRIFFTSGKITQGTFKAASADYNRIYASLCTNGGNYVVYSDDFGDSWSILGNAVAQAGGDEAHVTELPNGDILLDSRVPAGGRMVNIFAYSNRETAEGLWGTQGQKSIDSGNACNGDIDVMTGYALGSTEPVSILVQTAPRNSGRSNVRYYYKTMPALTNGHYTLSDFVGGWTEGYQVCAGSSAYSSIVQDGQGNEYMLYERNETGNTFYYDIVFEKHSISQITNNAYLAEPAKTVTINYTLTDNAGGEYEGSYQALEGTLPTFTGIEGITFANPTWSSVQDGVQTLTATIKFPFLVSSYKKQNHYHISSYDANKLYWYAKDNGQVAVKLNNTPSSNEEYDWAFYPTLDGSKFTVRIKNKKYGQYITTTSVADKHDAGIVTLSAEGTAFTYDSNKQFGTTLTTVKYLSVNNSTQTAEQNVGTYSTHNGTKTTMAFCTPEIVAGKFYRLKSHKYGTYLSSTTGRYNNNDNVFAMTSAQDATTICYLTSDNHLIMYATGLGLCDAIQTQTANLSGNTVLTFQADARTTPADGCYNIKAVYNNQTKWLYGYQGNLARNGNYDPEECVWEIEEVDALPVTVGATGFATFYTPVEVALPAGVTAYVGNLAGSDLNLYFCKQTDDANAVLIPAETAVMLHAAAEGTYNLRITEGGQAEGYDNNSFFGDVATKPFDSDATYYSLQRDNEKNDGTVGFFIKPSGNFKGFQAFLKTPVTQSPARINVIVDGEDNVITSLSSSSSSSSLSSSPIYDLSGRKMQRSSANGIYIVGGKKIVK